MFPPDFVTCGSDCGQGRNLRVCEISALLPKGQGGLFTDPYVCTEFPPLPPHTHALDCKQRAKSCSPNRTKLPLLQLWLRLRDVVKSRSGGRMPGDIQQDQLLQGGE
ncbi:hypothetical protein KIL84_022768 [Mauremys mutica]|uniref:Uncharacterized protein n=1 Tax=Mauremys mutica TaxID=74926 RepID=A0A9D4AP95_9SAUR|nr:hypothetical protein KIL84_022768 [Mauremys mutica]